jgi:predicted acylesterase/phospholipase RssA
MTVSTDRKRAIVLGGGGVTGIAWETGVLAGLQEAGVDLRADAVFGTSAGSFAGTALAGGADFKVLHAAQHRPAADEPQQSIDAIGPNPYDPDRRGSVADAGRQQGLQAAARINELWR